MADQITQLLNQIEPIAEPILAQLRPLTKTLLPEQIVNLGRDYYSRDVFDKVIVQLDLFEPENAPLVQQFISKTLSLGILSMSSIVKLPQILNILSNSSAQGLSFPSILMDTLSYLITIAYNFRQHMPFTNFGEVVFSALQNVVILALILYYTNRAGYINAFIGLCALVTYFFLGSPSPSNIGVLSDKDVNFLAQFAAPLTILAKLPQIIGNFKRKSTGTLSLTSIGAGLLGTIVRVFTVLSSGFNDRLILLGYGASVVLNLILFLQIIAFKKKKVSSEKKNK